MSGPATGTASPGAPGVLEIAVQPPVHSPLTLNPQALLQRLRPLRLSAIARFLNEYDRYNLGHRLVDSLFPGRMQTWTGANWREVLHYLVCLVEEFDWFAVDWAALNEAYHYWLEMYDEDEADGPLASFLHYIPVKLYGFTPEDFYDSENRVYELFWLLLKPDVTPAGAEVLIEAELYDLLAEWTDQDRAAVWQRLEGIEADPGQYPEPVQALPPVARWVCGRSGNFILDQYFDPDRDGPWFSWEEDVDRVRDAWQRAKPVLAYGYRLEQWYQNDPSNLSKLAQFLMEGTNDDEFDW
jgi:hypothetical protein